MGKLGSKCAGFERIGLAVVVSAMSLAWPATAADDDADGEVLKNRLGAVFYRSMSHWKYDYSKMPDRKAGVACIPWQRLDEAFLDSAIFEALGFSYSVATDEAATRIATQGCKQMKAHYKLTDCACQVVLIGEAVAITMPKETDKE